MGQWSTLEEVGLKRIGAWVCAVTALMVPGVASATTIAPTGAPTAVREYAGTIVFSMFEPATNQWLLYVRPPGGVAELLPVAPSPTPFEADIGPDSAGRPALIYQRCGGTPVLPTGCDLFVLSLTGATGERPVRSANSPARNDTRPTLWRGRIAWTREYGTQVRPNPVVYTKTLTGEGSRRSRRVPGVPRRRCGNVEGECGRTTGRAVRALELRGDRLALIVGFACRGCSGIQQSELRLDDLRRRATRLVAFQAIGLSGQALIGPSFSGGRLAWYKSCSVDPTGCKRGGAFRYGLSTRRYQRATTGPVRVDGFADAGALLYEVTGCSEAAQAPFVTGCRVDEVPPPRYERTRAPLR
jgi:hypothetical protein